MYWCIQIKINNWWNSVLQKQRGCLTKLLLSLFKNKTDRLIVFHWFVDTAELLPHTLLVAVQPRGKFGLWREEILLLIATPTAITPKQTPVSTTWKLLRNPMTGTWGAPRVCPFCSHAPAGPRGQSTSGWQPVLTLPVPPAQSLSPETGARGNTQWPSKSPRTPGASLSILIGIQAFGEHNETSFAFYSARVHCYSNSNNPSSGEGF